ncbi:SCO-spondin-like [Mytilus galloprovincialis]|uniref:SCO-spondin-like n=1 Tax=Mytilus galloprovincialis TaxID=29158 RepID=UPI003F7BFE6D
MSTYCNGQIYKFSRNETFSHPRKKLNGHIISEFTTKHLVTQCAMECFQNKRCASFNFDQEAHVCQLNDATHIDYPGDFENNNSEFDYHLRGAFSIDPEAVGPCGSYPCKNDGRCLDNYRDEDGNRIYLCLCSNGWGGHNCDILKHRLTWSDWSGWGECSASCGNGYQIRNRGCKDTVTDEDRPDSDCYGSDIEYQTCPYKDCPRWDEWGGWDECSTKKTCGPGTMVRSRNCSHGGVVGVDRYCLGPTLESAVCHSLKCKGMVRFRNGTLFGEGRVELHNDISREWLQVCGDHWDLPSAQIVCKQRGFIGAFNAISDSSYPSNASQPGILVKCNGTEKTLQACERHDIDSCKTVAGAQCRVKGVWSLWASWGECSVTCEDGIRTRRRECNHPPPNNGGKPCPGNDVDYKNCTMIMCPVDGFWAAWSPWSDCSVTCENGTQYRTRKCNAPEYDGADCPGDDREVRGCFPKMCPVDGYWTEWKSWSECSATCGYGNRNRSRTCIEPLYEGAPCPGPDSEIEACNSFSCPIDGSWKLWESWSDCSTTCGGGGRNRTRECNEAMHGGGDCIGVSSQTESCNTHNCPVDGVWLEWAGWTDCSLSCAMGWQSRNRTCLGPFYGGDNCTGDISEVQNCMLVECPVDGVWQPWSLWDSCNITCGGGGQNRYRTCIQPQFGGAPCNGSEIDYRDCNTHHCPVNGTWYAWSNWTDCTTTCGGGLQTRNRTCEQPQYGGFYCEGPDQETRNCSTHNCPVDGYWEDWTDWAICPVTCGGGRHNRSRTCVEPLYGGQYCDGNSSEIQDCNVQDCPVDGQWDLWTDWSDCTLTCGSGTQMRNRTCVNPKFGGSSCIGESTEEKTCNKHHCPVDGYWLEWSEWDECSESCGDGEQTRNRTCMEPLYGGKPCDGNINETKHCYIKSCAIDGFWMPWTEWSDCDLTCGGGTRFRNRTCNGPYLGGEECNGTALETDFCSMTPCPVDGMFTPWMPWTACDVSCGGGSKSRKRFCNGPYYGGRDCNGSLSEVEDCSTGPCPVDGMFTEWTLWQSCPVTCGGAEHQRERICVGPFYGGADCDGDSIGSRKCNENPCPVDGQWSLWSQWADCTVICGGGTARRYRFCTPSANGGEDCEGHGEELMECNNQTCPIDGIFGEWTEWSDCTKMCGGGDMYRNRTCIGPWFGGQPCDGQRNQNSTCNEHDCPVDGFWDKWKAWGVCNVTCGGGMQIRLRECIMPLHGGQGCDGTNTDSQECNTNHCPIDGEWKEWGKWNHCSTTCGGGIQTRNRECIEPQYGGAPCHGNNTDYMSCNDFECPIDGVWEEWESWSECTLTCGTGTQFRNRTCDGPYFDGAPCNGSDLETQDCNTHNCPLDGIFSEWSDWFLCSATCGGGEQSRNRTCTGPYYGGAPCEGRYNDSQSCNGHECPIDGVWTNWTSWDTCNVTCGGGIHWRYRSCDGPFFGGANCSGPAEDSQTCNGHPCPIDGYWNDWNNWETCNVTCGGGIQQRSRTCVEPLYGGAECTGPDTDYQDCNTQSCPVDGYYEDWGQWENCTVICGGGTKTRRRTCIEPMYGGANCTGPSEEDTDCNTHNCPVDGVWKVWSDWTDCTTSCGGGTSTRNRTCTGPYYGGADCEGVKIEDTGCNTNPCPINGDWFEWGPWSLCTVTCDGGLRSRSRECDMDSYGNLTAACAGDATVTEACHTFSCTPYEPHCNGWGQRGLVDSAHAWVAPVTSNGYQLDEVEVYCDMDSHNGTGVTVIGHNKEMKTRVSGFEGSGDYALILTYNISIGHAASIIDASEDCRQFLQWQCKGAVIHNPNQEGHWTTYWTNRTTAYIPDGQQKPAADYFPGAVPGSGMCACGSNNNCNRSDVTCNCDINDADWRSDEGYVTNKAELPIVAFYAGDTGNEGVEEGVVTIGRIYCTGDSNL